MRKEKKIRILILEDGATEAERMAEALKTAGMNFVSARVNDRTGFENGLVSFSPDAILSDCPLSLFDEESALETAKQKGSAIPFIFVACDLGEDRAVELLEKGATDLVFKDQLWRLPLVLRRALDEAGEIRRRKRAEEKLYARILKICRTREELRKGGERLERILNSITDAHVALDRDGRFLEVNPYASNHIFGRPTEELIGKCFWDLYPQAGKSVFFQKYERAWKKGEPVHLEAKSGIEMDKWIEVHAIPFEDRMDVYFRDITRRKRMEKAMFWLNKTLEQRVAERTAEAEARTRQLQAMSGELVEAEERVRQRIATVLHNDLQQLLAATRMQQQVALTNLQEDSPAYALFLNVEALLAESIQKSRRLSHELSPPVLHHSGLIAGCEWLARHMEEQFGLHVKIEVDTNDCLDYFPLKVFLFRAIQELLFNIVKHAGVEEACVRLTHSDAHLVIAVSDQGRGLDRCMLESAEGGEGFGLFSLRERARSFGGALIVESAPGQGCRFTLKIPVKLAEDGKPVVPVTAEGGVPASGNSIRVLFADDDPLIRQWLIAMIEGEPGIEVVGEAANGKEAVGLVRELNPDVVVIDASMPELDGIEATRLIKEQWPGVRVIGLSIDGDERIARRMYQAGASGIVTKTASSSELIEAVYGETGVIPSEHEKRGRAARP